MPISQRTRPAITLGVILGLVGALAACSSSSSSPTAPATPTTLAGISLSATSAVVGSTVQATVTLAAAAPPGGLSVALSSSNPAVATVPSQATVASGATTVVVSITAIAQGSTIISATLNGSSQQSPTLTVTPAAVLSSLSLSASTVVGGNPVTGTVVLSAVAPAGGAVVSLSAGDPATVPATVTVPPGSSSATFTVTTRAVGGTLPATITASYGGISVSAGLSVTRPTQATAIFGVTGTETDTCALTNGGNTLNCTFNGSRSTAPGTIIAWDWSFGSAKTFVQTTTGPVLAMPTVDCTIVPAPPLPAGATWFPMTVTLKVHDDAGNVSAEAVNSGVRLFPQGMCGF